MVPLTLPARVALMKRTPNCSGFGSESRAVGTEAAGDVADAVQTAAGPLHGESGLIGRGRRRRTLLERERARKVDVDTGPRRQFSRHLARRGVPEGLEYFRKALFLLHNGKYRYNFPEFFVFLRDT